MKLRILPMLALVLTVLAACAPSADRPTLRPQVFALSAPAAAGENVTIQGRYLGGAANSVVIFRADEVGRGGVRTTTADIVSWTSSMVVVKVPAGTRPGGGFLFVEVGGTLSNAMPYSVN